MRWTTLLPKSCSSLYLWKYVSYSGQIPILPCLWGTAGQLLPPALTVCHIWLMGRDVFEVQKGSSREAVLVSSGEVVLSVPGLPALGNIQTDNEGIDFAVVQVSSWEMKLTDPRLPVLHLRTSFSKDPQSPSYDVIRGSVCFLTSGRDAPLPRQLRRGGSDPCYQLDGRPRHCLSEFINAAYGVPVRAGDSWGGSEKNVSSLTDLHNPHNLTCWVGEGVGGDWTLIVPLGRRFEVTYISLQFCQQGELPDSLSISILKSMDHRRSWRPLQFYSSDCLGKFGVPSRNAAPTRHQETEPLCSDPRPLQRHRGGLVLAFSTLDGRPSSPDFDYSPVLQDWVTATDIKVVFHRHQSKPLKEEFGRERAGAKASAVAQKEGHHRIMCLEGACDWTADGRGGNSRVRELRKRRTDNRSIVEQRQRSRSLQLAPRPPSSLPVPSPRPPLSLSDLQVGGRCKCNGHASQCRRDVQGRAICQCEHHTAGPDCDACQPFYCDRPWQRATPTQPHPCIPCECNGHSLKCRFSMEVFQQSGRRSGGVCLKCSHHTTGRHCQYCQNGYTRDHSRPMAHRKACRPCQCHPMGAVGRWCNQTSGQCLCRDGVTGVRCNRCAPGYQQGRSPIRPCLRIQEVVPTTPVYQPQYSIAEECGSYCKPSQVKVKMNLATYCLKDYVLKVQVRGMERSGPWWQFSVWVQSMFRVGASQVRRGLQALWVPDRDLGCGCPALQVGRTFLLIGAEDGQSWSPEESRLVADRSSLALPWREHWSAKLRVFRGQDRRGRCPTDLQKNSTRPRSPYSPHAEFIPPHLEPPHSETPSPHPLPSTQTSPPPHTYDPPDSQKPHPAEGGGSPRHQHSHPPSTDAPRAPPAQQSRHKPKPPHTRKHSPTTQPIQPPH
ncbi:hypothetical protein AAFF_G00325160 [Aldrovandia affinis]|uniref:Netrin 5 n=1 Tax=Aldrovandia affinis TaxID=143900 RepID=A0AAD7X1F2_9TELE|nr:hypothetical protein AAFF_G00325160 [Aldrovandia affinis]